MNRKLITLSAAVAALAFGASTASATTIIGSTGQSNQQGVNSSQSGSNGSGGGATYLLGSSTPTLNQGSTNTLNNSQTIGGGAGTTTLIAPSANGCFCQSSKQGVNSSQVGANGDGGGGGTSVVTGNSSPTLNQGSNNTLNNSQVIGGGSSTIGPATANPAAATCTGKAGPISCTDAAALAADPGTVCKTAGAAGFPNLIVSCLLPGAVIPASTILIGGAAQANEQGVNSSQSGQNGGAFGGTGSTFVLGGSSPTLNQGSENTLNSRVILG